MGDLVTTSKVSLGPLLIHRAIRIDDTQYPLHEAIRHPGEGILLKRTLMIWPFALRCASSHNYKTNGYPPLESPMLDAWRQNCDI